MLAIVTGANRGIGFEVCKQLGENTNINLLLSSRNETQGLQALNQLQSKHNVKGASYFPLDIEDEVSRKTFTKYVRDNHASSKLILILNAGIYLDDWNERAFEESMKVNCYSNMRLVLDLFPIMKKNEFGRIVAVSSSYGKLQYLSSKYQGIINDVVNSEPTLSNPDKLPNEYENFWKEVVTKKVLFDPHDEFMKKSFKPTYKLSKACLNAFVRTFSSSLQQLKLDDKIIINAADPGWVKTDMGGPDAPGSVEEGADVISWLAAQSNSSGSGRFFAKRKITEW